MIGIDVSQFMQIVEMAIDAAFYTVLGICFGASLFAAGMLLWSLWESRND